MTPLTHLLAALAGVFFGAILMSILILDNPEKPRRGYDALDEDEVRDFHVRNG